MSSMNETLERIKSLYNYGQTVNEDNNKGNRGIIERTAVAANGNTYALVRECNKYYIKQCTEKGKEMLPESYEYLGGFCNRKNHEYSSYNLGSQQFDLKIASINEGVEGRVNLDESLKDFHNNNQIMTEATQGMKDELARVRQIMYNSAMIMNEATEISASRKDNVVMYDGKNPEAETGKKGDEGGKKASANPAYAGSKTNGVDKKVGPFDQNAKPSKDQLKEGEDCCGGNCKCEKFGCDWGSTGIGKGKDPKQVGWEMEGQRTVNEEENDWASKGLPGTPGVGEADTDHNNDPFNKGVNEGCCGEGEDADFSGDEDMADDTDFDAGVQDIDADAEGEDITSDDDFDVEDDDLEGEDDFDAEGGEDLGGEEDFDAEGGDDFEGGEDDFDTEDDDLGGDDDIMAQIEDLQAQIDALKAQVDGEDEGGFDTEDDFEGGEDDFDTEGDEDFGGEDDFDAEGEDDFEGGEDDFDTEDDGESFEDDMDECDGSCGMPSQQPMQNGMMEAKRKKMNSIVESVVKKILAEEGTELHDFGKHPGYRKKVMTLPANGEDKNQWGRDWNDESVHGEEPFGSKIGNGDPFNELVNAVTKDVMYQLKKGTSPIEGEKKN